MHDVFLQTTLMNPAGDLKILFSMRTARIESAKILSHLYTSTKKGSLDTYDISKRNLTKLTQKYIQVFLVDKCFLSLSLEKEFLPG